MNSAITLLAFALVTMGGPAIAMGIKDKIRREGGSESYMAATIAVACILMVAQPVLTFLVVMDVVLPGLGVVLSMQWDKPLTFGDAVGLISVVIPPYLVWETISMPTVRDLAQACKEARDRRKSEVRHG